ncbi:unnamed protein product [Rotaria sp. Silwood1]|nr:unnamed protein product [Rotaria sp. Silwood1]
MSSDYQSFVEYVSLEKCGECDIQFNTTRINEILDKFKELYGDENIDDSFAREETVKKLMDELKIIDDSINFEYVDMVVQQNSDEDKIRIELRDKFLPPVDMNEPTAVFTNSTATSSVTTEPSTTASPTTTGSSSTKAKKSKKTKLEQLIENKSEIVDNIICIIHKKGPPRDEIDDFFRDFLFSKIQAPQQQSISPIFDEKPYDLDRGTILDLFIRQQMIDRGLITFSSPRSRFRLVESVSLTDEFDSWIFDHFHGLMDIWLAIDLTNQTKFPEKWKLSPTANIKYTIVKQLPSGDAEQTTKHIERPSTKQLDSFIRDVCLIEDNGLADVWLEALRKKENIETYAHLANLNQQEWEKIDELPMNALKILKLYVDREKQMAEECKKKTVANSNENDSYSKAELRANLHMIKLYFVRQLEGQDGIPTLPRLEKFCVETAFDEMRAEGFEDDGLFGEMQLFFQPLTITENELCINPSLRANMRRKELEEQQKLQSNIDESNETLAAEKARLKTANEEYEKLKKQRDEEVAVDSNKPPPANLQEKTKRNMEWAKKDDTWRKVRAACKKEIKEFEDKIKRIETSIANSETSLDEVKKTLANDKTKIDQRLVKPHRGFIMYGPPGTGKSVIMSKLAKKVGIAMLGPPLAAGELERPLVGQSEAIILSLCMRGNRLPHLLCCVSIDEIDSLAPRRDEDSSEGKVAKISVLLSVIEGIKDVPNLMFFSATNRLHMMDEAFLRRMSGKFFVGRPSSISRKKILEGIPNHIIKLEIREKLATATTNFSGAALNAITVHDIAVRRKDPIYEMKEDEALLLADKVAQQYQLFLGLDTLPRLTLQNLYTRQQSSRTKIETIEFRLLDQYRFTGKIIISLEKNQRYVRIEGIRSQNDELYVHEDPLNETEQSLQQLLERITSYGDDRNVQLLQLIDLNLLSSKGAYDEKKIFETLKERYDECIAYKRSMIVYDLDSLIGVNRSESESSMGTSVSSSVVNQSIYTYVVSRFREAKLEASKANKNEVNERWAIAVSRDQFLLKKFTADVNFTLTAKQEEEQEEEERRSKVPIFCAKCRDHYIETENKMGACCYHDGFVYDNLAPGLDKHFPSEAIRILNKEESLPPPDPTQKDQVDRKKSRFKYICCSATLQVGSGFNGCKKGEHNFGTGDEKKRHAKTKKKDLIAEWENVCFYSPDNYDAYNELMDSRDNP